MRTNIDFVYVFVVMLEVLISFVGKVVDLALEHMCVYMFNSVQKVQSTFHSYKTKLFI